MSPDYGITESSVTRSVPSRPKVQPHLFLSHPSFPTQHPSSPIPTSTWLTSPSPPLRIFLSVRLTTGGIATRLTSTRPVSPPPPRLSPPFRHHALSTSCTHPMTNRQHTVLASRSRHSPWPVISPRRAPRCCAHCLHHCRREPSRPSPTSATPPTPSELASPAAAWDAVLTDPRYYFHPTGPTDPCDSPYPIVPDFRSWRFPHGNLEPERVDTNVRTIAAPLSRCWILLTLRT